MRGFEQIPWLYDAILAVSESTGLRRWRRWLAAGANGRILDLGCGTGRNLPLFAAGTRPEAATRTATLKARSSRRALPSTSASAGPNMRRFETRKR
jgi:SAM-dependent methyltransferase